MIYHNTLVSHLSTTTVTLHLIISYNYLIAHTCFILVFLNGFILTYTLAAFVFSENFPLHSSTLPFYRCNPKNLDISSPSPYSSTVELIRESADIF